MSKLPKEIRDNLISIGNEVASLWGGECYNAVPDDDREIVVFHCIEHGEDFVSEVKYSELGEYAAICENQSNSGEADYTDAYYDDNEQDDDLEM